MSWASMKCTVKELCSNRRTGPHPYPRTQPSVLSRCVSLFKVNPLLIFIFLTYGVPKVSPRANAAAGPRSARRLQTPPLQRTAARTVPSAVQR